MALAECYQLPGGEPLYPGPRAAPGRAPRPAPAPAPTWAPPLEKDYSVPLHVDCSVEYELPDCAKPPQGVKIEPLLMIHPAHFRRLDSLRRCPFVNNLPAASGGGRLAYELPPVVQASCQARPRQARAPCKVRESPQRPAPAARRWPRAAPSLCCKGAVQHPELWGGCEAPPAPREGDTLEASHFGKCPKPRSARQRAAPYALDAAHLPAGPTAAALAPNCDKTFEMLQGNRLISPFHAKMFSSDSVYQNYPIVLYK